mgnify:CR=1 FL=1
MKNLLRISLLVSFLIGMNSIGFSQKKMNFLSDSVHSPKKATIYSAVLPGLGQAYNRKYWKIPIVYAAIGGCVTAAVINHNSFDLRKQELKDRAEFGSPQSSRFSRFTDGQLLESSDYYRKWRDNMIIFSCLAYTLNIIDANVDAHLFNFNVDEDLSLNWSPYLFSPDINRPVSGVSLTLRFR